MAATGAPPPPPKEKATPPTSPTPWPRTRRREARAAAMAFRLACIIDAHARSSSKPTRLRRKSERKTVLYRRSADCVMTRWSGHRSRSRRDNPSHAATVLRAAERGSAAVAIAAAAPEAPLTPLLARPAPAEDTEAPAANPNLSTTTRRGEATLPAGSGVAQAAAAAAAAPAVVPVAVRPTHAAPIELSSTIARRISTAELTVIEVVVAGDEVFVEDSLATTLARRNVEGATELSDPPAPMSVAAAPPRPP